MYRKERLRGLQTRPAKIVDCGIAILLTAVLISCAAPPSEAANKKIGTIQYVEGTQVSVEVLPESMPDPGTRLEAKDYQGHSVAVLKVTDKRTPVDYEIICNVIKGTSDIRQGYEVFTRTGLSWAIVPNVASFPVEVGSFQTGSSSETATYFALTAYLDPRNLKGWGKRHPGLPMIGTAVIDFKSYWAWEIVHLGYVINLEAIPEVLQLEIGGAAGLVLGLGSVQWQTPEGVSYDSLGTAGKAHPGISASYRGFVGFSYQLTRKIRPFFQVAYFGYTIPKYSDVDSYNQDTGKAFEIDPDFLEKRLEGKGGVSLQAGIEFWYNM